MHSHSLWQIVEPNGGVACVTSMWQGVQKGKTHTFVSIHRCAPQSLVHPFYGMRTIQKLDTECLININVSVSLWYTFSNRYPSFSMVA